LYNSGAFFPPADNVVCKKHETGRLVVPVEDDEMLKNRSICSIRACFPFTLKNNEKKSGVSHYSILLSKFANSNIKEK